MKLWWVAAALLGLQARAAEMPWGRGESRGEDLEISLVTFSPGDEIASYWGHTGLVVEDRRLGVSRLYNYGYFVFDDRMLARFLVGRLEFWVGEDPAVRTFQLYAAEKRDVRLQVLDLPPERRLAMAKALADNVRPENRNYLYHHYNDNCSTRPRDQIDRAVAGQLHTATAGPGRMTLREHTRRYTAVNPPLSLLLDFLMNDEIDRPIAAWDEMFLPDELERNVGALHPAPQGQPLVARQVDYFRSGRAPPPATPTRWTPWVFLASSLFAGVGALLARSRGRAGRVALGLQHALLGLVVGLPGLVLFLGWVFTEHTVMHRNQNLFWGNPLTLGLAPLGVMYAAGSTRGKRWLPRWSLGLSGLAVLGLALLALPSFDQDIGRTASLIVPALLGLTGALLARERRRAETSDPPAKERG